MQTLSWGVLVLAPSVCVQSLAQLCPTLDTSWTVVSQAPLSMRFPRQEYWSGLPFPSPGDLPDLGIEPVAPTMAGRFFTTWATWDQGSNPGVCIGSMELSFIINYLFTLFFFLVALNLRCCTRAFCSCSQQGLLCCRRMDSLFSWPLLLPSPGCERSGFGN